MFDIFCVWAQLSDVQYSLIGLLKKSSTVNKITIESCSGMTALTWFSQTLTCKTKHCTQTKKERVLLIAMIVYIVCSLFTILAISSDGERDI